MYIRVTWEDSYKHGRNDDSVQEKGKASQGHDASVGFQRINIRWMEGRSYGTCKDLTVKWCYVSQNNS